MRAWVEPVPASSSELIVRGIHILQVLSLVFDNAGIPEARAVFKFSEIARQHARAAALQPAHEHILGIRLLAAFKHRFQISPHFLTRTAF